MTAYVVLAVVWLLALLGAVGKLTQWLKPGRVSTLLYVGLGWASLLLLWPLVNAVPLAALLLMVAGGLVYTLGSIFNHLDDLRFNVAIWHAFVLGGSGLFFAAIVMSMAANRA